MSESPQLYNPDPLTAQWLLTSILSVTPAEWRQFEEAARKQFSAPENVLPQLVRDYADYHNPSAS